MPRKFTRPLLASAAIIVTFCAPASTVMAQSETAAPLFQRSAKGDLSAAGGARRLDGDITAAFRDQIRKGPARNVILLIGDGMGDSEITVARNYAVGAGNHFKGIDALPVTGQIGRAHV